MPTRCIQPRSSLMPSLVILPFIQCHHTRGFALSGGFSKPLCSESVVFCAAAMPRHIVARTPVKRRFLDLDILLPFLIPAARRSFQTCQLRGVRDLPYPCSPDRHSTRQILRQNSTPHSAVANGARIRGSPPHPTSAE